MPSISAEAINALVKTEATNATNAALNAAIPVLAGKGIFAYPDNMKTIDMENKLPLRRRPRGTMSTDFVTPFAAYAAVHAEPGAKVFVDAEQMKAEAVLNFGSVALAGHCDNLTEVTLKRTAAYAAMLNLINSTKDQREFSEWLEEWGFVATCWENLPAAAPVAEGEAAQPRAGSLEMSACIAAIRSVTIDTAKKFESEVGNFSQNLTESEKIAMAAKGNQKLPSFLELKFKPYKELSDRTFIVRVSAVTGRSQPEFRLNVLGMETHREEMAEEFAQVVRDAFTSMEPLAEGQTQPTVLIGSYTKAS